MASPLPRSLAAQVRADLKRKMVFVSGPRQVGKTTLARRLLTDAAGYLNWDVPEHRDAILRGRLPATGLLVFDELHKYRQWRGFLKGLYDRRDGRRILVAGSGRLDYYRQWRRLTAGPLPPPADASSVGSRTRHRRPARPHAAA